MCAAVVAIPAGVTEIPEKAFYECEILKTVTIPDSVTTIGKDAFYDCASLESVHLSRRAQFVESGNDRSFPASCVVTRY